MSGVTVAALYVDPLGPYPKMPGVDCWDEARDARKYTGPARVVAHPPCQRWGRYWSGGPSAGRRFSLGADAGCFAAALKAVREFGGVLEHPEASHAFAYHGLARPSWRGGWVAAGDGLGWVCCVAQGNYGHRSRKLTWLYAAGPKPAELDWSVPPPMGRMDEGFRSKAHADSARSSADWQPRPRLSKAERVRTPQPFADLLVALARGAR